MFSLLFNLTRNVQKQPLSQQTIGEDAIKQNHGCELLHNQI